jgi:transposase
MAASQEQGEQGELFGTPSTATAGVPEAVVVNGRVLVRTREDLRLVVAGGIVLSQYAVGDRMAQAHAMVLLVEQGWAEQIEVAVAFGYTARTVRRYQERFEAGGLAALGQPGGYPRGRSRASGARTRLVNRLHSEGRSNREIAIKLGVSEKAVRKLLRRLGWPKVERQTQQLPLETEDASAEEDAGGADPNLSAPTSGIAATAAPAAVTGSAEGAMGADPNLSGLPQRGQSAEAASAPTEEPLPFSFDKDPSDRRLDRFFAYLGLLDDAAPLFRPGLKVPGAGALLAVPALVESGILEVAREVYGSIGPAFYGLRTTMVALLLMALLRIKRPEGLKERPPDDFGRVLGLDRAPEVKTLRRKLARLASFGRAAEFGRVLARHRAASRGAALGFLYVDGHVRAYHGRHPIPKAHVARMRISMPATTDYWVGDAAGEPLLLITAEANAGLVEMLPRILDEVRRAVGERRLTIVFDRGGWSPRLFAQILERGFDILTYRKAPKRPVPRRSFQRHCGTFEGKTETYWLADQTIHLRLAGHKRLALRQVSRLAEDGRHQTPIVTSRQDLPALEVARRMFDRWRQENFFKYLREEYALDALLEYDVAPDDPLREVPNPARKVLDIELRATRAALAELQASYGAAALDNPEQARPTMRGFKITHGKIGRAIRELLRRVADLERRRSRTPTHVPVQTVVQAPVVKLAPERQHLASLIKMVAYQAESDLLQMIRPHYRRAEDEGRTLVQNVIASSADIEVTDTELHIRLAPLSSPHRSAAAAALCQDLSARPVPFPGTKLKLRFSVAPDLPEGESGQN